MCQQDGFLSSLSGSSLMRDFSPAVTICPSASESLLAPGPSQVLAGSQLIVGQRTLTAHRCFGLVVEDAYIPCQGAQCDTGLRLPPQPPACAHPGSSSDGNGVGHLLPTWEAQIKLSTTACRCPWHEPEHTGSCSYFCLASKERQGSVGCGGKNTLGGLD